MILSSALQLAIQVTVQNGFGSYTTTGAHAAYPTVPAGDYAFPDFVVLCAQKLRQYLFDDLAAAGSSANNGGAVDLIDLSLDFTASNTPNATRVAFNLRSLNALIGGAAAPITACTLVNTSGWATKLGLGVEGTNVSVPVASAQASLAGQFQPREIYTFLRSEIYGGPVNTTEIYEALPLSDGDAVQYRINKNVIPCEYQLVDADFRVAGFPVHVGNVSALAGDRLTLQFANPRRSPFTTGFYETGLQTDRLSAGDLVWVVGAGDEGYVVRVRTVTAGVAPAVHQVALWEKLPSTHTLKTPSPVYRVSEAWACRFDSKTRAKGKWLLYGASDDSGQARHTPESHLLQGDSGTFREEVQRRDLKLDRYSISFRTLLRTKSGLTLVTT